MSDIELVIKIHEEDYKKAIEYGHLDMCGTELAEVVLEVVSKGTPLPKGHGRLGDLSKIYVELNEAQVEGSEEYKGLGEAKQIVYDTPTIIEADKGVRA